LIFVLGRRDMSIAVRGQLIEVDMSPRETRYRLLEGPGILISHFGETLRLMPGRPLLVPRTIEGPPPSRRGAAWQPER
jgi:hypothetical protein